MPRSWLSHCLIRGQRSRPVLRRCRAQVGPPPPPPPPPPHPPTPPCCSAADPCPSFPCGAAAIAGVGTADVPDRQKIQCKYNYIEFISTIVLIYKYYCGVFESGVFVVE